MASYKPVESVARAFRLFAELNRAGSTTVTALHQKTGLPKPTVVRLLETLIAEGYVYKDNRMGGYQVTGQAAILSSGFHGAPLAIEAARPWAIDLTRRLKWPTGICTLQDDGVIVRYSTIVDSPISPFHSTIGVKLSLGRRALGLAYLAFCPEDERALLMEIMRNSSDPENHFKTPRRLDEIIEQTRRNGYAQRDRDVAPRSSDTLAMPLRLGERVLATFGVTYFRSALRPSDLEDALVEPLRATVETIERELEVMAKIPASGIA